VAARSLILSRIFWFPDVVVSIITGMLATSTAYWMNHIISKRWKKRKGQLVALNILSGIVCLYSLKLIGFCMKVLRISSSRALFFLFSHNCDYSTYYFYAFINREYLCLNNLPLLNFSLLIPCFIFILLIVCDKVLNNHNYFPCQCNNCFCMPNRLHLPVKKFL
jgi:hypothetical protein